MPHIWTLPPHGLMARLPLLALLVLILVASSVSAITFQLGSPLLGNMPSSDAFVRIQPLVYSNWPKLNTNSYPVDYSYTYISGAAYVSTTSYSAYFFAFDKFAYVGSDSQLPVDTITDANSQCLLFGGFQQQITATNEFQPNVFFVGAPTPASVLHMMWILLQSDRLPMQLSYYRIVSTGAGQGAMAAATTEPPKLGCSTVTYLASQTQTTADFNTLINSKPLALFMAGTQQPYDQHSYTQDFCNAVFNSAVLQQINTSMYTEFYMEPDVLTYYGSNTRAFPRSNIFVSSPTPSITQTAYPIVQGFTTEITSVQSNYLSSNSNFVASIALAGWVTTRVAMQSVMQYSGPMSDTIPSLRAGMNAMQSAYVLHDTFFGTFAGAVTAFAQEQGAIGSSSFVGNAMYLSQMTAPTANAPNGDFVGVPNSEYIFGLGKTLQLNSGYYLDTITLYATAYAVGVSLTDDPVTAYVCDQASVATGVVQRTSPNTVSNHGYRGRCVSSTTAGITAALAADVATYVTTNLLIGVLPDGFDTSSRFVVDPIPASPSLRVASSNMVYLFATLEQQMYVSAVYLYMHLRPKLASTKVCGIVRGPQATAILDLMNLTMTTFGMEMQQADMVSLSAGGNMVAAIPAGCDVVLLIGIAGNEVSSLQAFLASNPSTFAFVDFDALTMNYPNFVTSFGTTNAATKLLFATNLPSWTTATATTSPTAARQFLNAAGANYNTPAALRQMYVSLLIDQLTNNGNTQALPTDLQTIFSKIDTAITLGGLNFGPFNPNDCLSVAGVEEPNDCLVNTGARDLLVWSLAYMQTPGRGPLTAPTTPSMMYNAFYVHSTSSSNDVVTEVVNTAKCRDFNPESIAGSSSSGSNHLVNPFGSSSSKEVSTRKKKVLDGVLFALLGLLLLIVLILILVVLWLWGYLRWCCAPTVSSTKESAKDAKLYEAVRSPSTKEELSRCHTVTVATVDVAASVALWTTVPRAMSAATLASRRAVRAAAVRHGCYEVRHLGDVFVVACRDPPCALAFATEVQRNARGGVNGRVRDEVAASYERLVNAREDARTVKPPAPAPGACLLLRVGVHAGVRTHGEDLDAACERLGDVALRAGGVAGCAAGTIVTRDALPPSDDRVVLTSLGAYALGNSTEPMELFKLQQQRSTSDTAATEAYFTVPHGVQMLRSGTEHSDAPLAEYVRQTMGAVTCASSTPTHRSLLHHVHHSFGMDTQVVPAESAREAAVVERTTAILERRRRVGLGIAVPRHPHLMKRCGAGSTGDVLTAANGIEIEAAGTTSLSLHAWEVVSRGTVGAHRGPYQDADWIGGVELSRSGEALTATEVVEGGALNNDPWRGEVVGVHAPSSVERCFSRSESLPLHAEEVVHGRHPRGVTDEEPRYSEWQQSSCTKGTSVQPLLSDNSPVLYRRGSLPDKEVHAVPRGQAPSLGRRGLRYISREMVDSVELLGASFVDKDVDDLDHENVQTRTLMKGEHQPWSQVDPVQQQLARGAGASPVTVSAAKEAPPGVEELSVEDLGCEVPPRGQLSEECADINSSEPSSINPSFLRGQTTFVADRVKPCFSQGNGLLFRMTNSTTGQWAYYNATTDYMMHVHFVAGAKSRIVALGSTKLLPPDEQRQHYQGDLWVGPKCTELLMAGTLRGYDVQYKAIPLSRIM